MTTIAQPFKQRFPGLPADGQITATDTAIADEILQRAAGYNPELGYIVNPSMMWWSTGQERPC